MANLNDGVGKKIVEALKKQSTGEAEIPVSQPVQEELNTGLGIDISALDIIQAVETPVETKQIPNFDEFFADDELDSISEPQTSFNDFMVQPEKVEASMICRVISSS